jgi:AcrR family transcriptional regulator
MAPRPAKPDRASPEAAPDLQRTDGEPGRVVRRAPFSDKPEVGARGQRTQQRILDAALAVFGDEGYHQTSIERITKQAGCSRASFYQYFSSKEDVFQQLTGQVARQLSASTEALGPLTPDEAGWVAIRAWVERHADIYRRYEPVFHAFQAAAEIDEDVAAGSARWSERTLARIRSRLSSTIVAPRQLDLVILLLMRCVTRTHEMASIVRSAAPDALTEDQVVDSMTDIIHRSLFGLDPAVNVHGSGAPRPAPIRFDRAEREIFARADSPGELTAAGQQTLTALCDAGREVFVRRGYHRTRVDDIVEVAGVSHGAFYRYFDNKDQLARTLAVRAMRTVALVLADIPTYDALAADGGRPLLRRWLRRYGATQTDEASILQVWVDASLQDATLRINSAPALDWGRRSLVPVLDPRGFGDVGTDALVMVALLSAFGAMPRPAPVDAVAHIIEHGLLGTNVPANGS